MVEYTNIELLDAFCESKNYTGTDKEGKPITKQAFALKFESFYQKRLDEQRARIQANLEALPSTAREFMKREAARYLAEKQAKQNIEDNFAGEL